MKIADFLSAADVAVDVRATEKSRLLKELSSRAAAALCAVASSGTAAMV